jgi:hypothetical protein
VRTILPYLLAGLVLAGCTRDEDDGPSVTPTIQFVTDAGYVFRSDTVSPGDTLRVGVVVQKGSEALDLFFVSVSYDNDAAINTDSLGIGSDQFEFEKRIIVRDQPGTELWRFNVVERDGDVVRRSLTFTVVE